VPALNPNEKPAGSGGFFVFEAFFMDPVDSFKSKAGFPLTASRCRE